MGTIGDYVIYSLSKSFPIGLGTIKIKIASFVCRPPLKDSLSWEESI